MIAGFTIMEWRASQERGGIKTVVDAIRSGQELDRLEASAAASGREAAVETLRQVVRQEVRSTATVTTRKTVRSTTTVTATETVIRPPFLPSGGCVQLPGDFEVCRREAAAGGAILGLGVLSFIAIRRTA